ncbi:unnamed protein product [Blepharisma stoltei]|uniref:Uncharacterized protein n=1 Tax=Blepharisma stoltei TaxID=1481888 RepID=A0AAU9JCF8_9CILI|nr:unnamed protein product [Blepharisma stoltei]
MLKSLAWTALCFEYILKWHDKPTLITLVADPTSSGGVGHRGGRMVYPVRFDFFSEMQCWASWANAFFWSMFCIRGEWSWKMNRKTLFRISLLF